MQVILDRLLADEQALGHVPVLEALRDQPDDFALARAQRRALFAKTLASGHVARTFFRQPPNHIRG